jgi:hypothetical protein
MNRKHLFASAALAAGVTLAASAPSNAAVLLELLNPDPGVYSYDLLFTAAASDTTLSVGGYQVPWYEQVYDNVVSTGGGPNLLGGAWNLTPASTGTDTSTYNDGTSVPALIFGAYSYINDTYSQSSRRCLVRPTTTRSTSTRKLTARAS